MNLQLKCIRCDSTEPEGLAFATCSLCNGELVTENLHTAHIEMNEALDRARFTADKDLIETMLHIDNAFRALWREIKDRPER